MEILQLETFLAVATYGGFHRAAEALRISQPAVSARISTLEETLGTRLFEREHGKFSLSLAGKALRPHAELLLRQVAIARQAVHELHPIAGGALPIAASLSICTYLRPEVLKKYQESHPNVIVSVRSGNSAQVLKMVLDGEVDLGLARSLNHPEVETIQLRDDPLILVGHPGHPAMASRKMVLEVKRIDAYKCMVLRKLGLAFLPQIALVEELRRGRLCPLEITNSEPLRRSLDVILPRRRPLSKSAKELVAGWREATQTIVKIASSRKKPRNN